MRKVLCVNSAKIIGMLSTGWVTLLGSKSCVADNAQFVRDAQNIAMRAAH
ncbi:MAG: hypothetical protein MR522_05590 [Trueperella sp.]|nr:hypothetical protein [Trueperella sp.]MCI7305723.1 hypothetical protein [Trueperella sp.]